jgi:hypothetical protein
MFNEILFNLDATAVSQQTSTLPTNAGMFTLISPF